MTSTQRSESANHMLKTSISRASPMHTFVEKFNELQFDRQDQESKERHVTKQKRRLIHTGFPIETNAQSIYTRALFERFYDSLFRSGKKRIGANRGGGKFVVVDDSSIEDDPMMHEVAYSPEVQDTVVCACGEFVHSGMLCPHALKVLVHLDTRHVPRGNIVRRWTKWVLLDGLVPPTVVIYCH